MKQTVYVLVTNAILASLRRGVVPWRKPWSATCNLPANALTNRPYRGVNVLLLGMSPYSDHRWLTFKQAQELGGMVKTGERSTMIVFWKQWEAPKEESEAKEKAKRKAPILRYFHVFNAEQCEGLRLPDLHVPQAEKEQQRIERADLLAHSMPNPPRIQERGSAAWYRPLDDLVQVPPLQAFETADAFYGTLFHELGHATGHKDRLNRPAVMGEIRFGSGVYSHEELVAELTSAFCCATVSLDNSLVEDSASYIGGWLKLLNADPKTVVIAAAQAQRATDYIKGIDYSS